MNLRLPRPPWYRDAACVGADTALFFPAAGRSATQAKAICSNCPVVQQCVEMALEDHGLEGVFGGMTAGERDQHRKATA